VNAMADILELGERTVPSNADLIWLALKHHLTSS
jgi:hypothetical protein